ncbi:MAG: extracellular solute-binding protein [Lachnospiraceae bacterium]|nr:extracellular solute-binding protein [Lachnospiraceae bacterium]
MKKKMKKATAVFCTFALAMSIMGCGGKEPTGSDVQETDNTAAGTEKTNTAKDSGTQESSDGEISGTITVWEHDYHFEACVRDVIAGFEKQYPNVTVEYEIKDDNYDSILSTAMQSGDGPDLFWTNGNVTATMGNFVSNGVCEDLTDKVDYSLMPEAAMGLTMIDGKSYSVPWLTMDTRTVYYNIDMFEENGWSVPKTFSEFEQLLATVKAAGITPISLCPNSPWTLLFAFEPILSGYDAEYSKGLADYSVPAAGDVVKGCLNKMLEWADKGYFGDNWLGVADENAQYLAFTTGNTAMEIGGSWEATTFSANNPDLNFGAFAVPAEDGTTGLVGTPANGFSVNSASENMDAALAFANYCATLEAQTIWVQSQGAVSASDKIEASTDIAKMISEGGKGNIYTSWQSVLNYHSQDAEANNIWVEDFSKVFTGGMTVDEFADEISAAMD